MNQETIHSTCPYCGVGCGVEINADTPEAIELKGDESHPSNFGNLCSKGLSLGETIDMQGRLLHPSINGQQVSWDNAIDYVANGFKDIVEEHGPDAIAFYVSGQLLTEDYYVANKLIKGFIGTGNIDTNSRLCMSSAVVGYKRAFGMDSVPTNYEDIEEADLFIITGSNMAWCHPVLFQRLRKAKGNNQNQRTVVIDPRKTSSCDVADIHLPIKPGTDATLFNGLLVYLSLSDSLNQKYIDSYTEGFDDSLSVARQSIQQLSSFEDKDISHEVICELVAEHCDVSLDSIKHFYSLYAKTDKTVTFYSMGINQSTSGSDKANAIINCHLATGRLGKPGMGPFSITGQPNAMGGREVGGLANQLAAHMDFGKTDKHGNQHTQIVEEFWQAPNMATSNGLMALDMFEAVEQGKIKAIWIMATNPVVSLPDADRWKKALEKCDMVVVSDCMKETDTADCANVLLPATGWGEKNGTVTNSERRISRQRPFRQPAGEARHDWHIISSVARAMGFKDAFSYQHPFEIFKEHARLSGFKNNGSRDFDISALSNITLKGYGQLKPFQWPLIDSCETPRLFSDGVFFTPSGKAQFIRIEPRKPANEISPTYPFILNTGRIRDQWHTMTRTGKSSRLSGHLPEPFVQIHPKDAQAQNIQSGELACVESQWGKVIVRVDITDSQQPGQVFVPMHWSEQYASQGRVDAVVNPNVDPFSAQPEFKHTPVSVSAWKGKWHGFILSKAPIDFDPDVYVVKNKGKSFWRYELAGDDLDKRPLQLMQSNQALNYHDVAKGTYRSAVINEGNIEQIIFISEDIDLPSRAWLASLFQAPIDASTRRALLAGRPMDASNDVGEIICSCYGVGKNTIEQAIQEKKLCTPEEIGQCLKAGTNCGSCVPELRNILKQMPVDKTASA